MKKIKNYHKATVLDLETEYVKYYRDVNNER